MRIIQQNLSVGRSETFGGEMKLEACKSDAFAIRRPFPMMRRWVPGVIELHLESGERPELVPRRTHWADPVVCYLKRFP